MSRNFELLQRAQRVAERTPLLTQVPRRPRDFGAKSESPASHACETGDSGDVRDRATLPVAALLPEQRREMLRLITTVYSPRDPGYPRAVGVAGVDHSGSSAWIAACLGELLAEHIGESVCVVDVNLRDRRLHREFGLPHDSGWSDAMTADSSINKICCRVAENLWVLGAGCAADNDVLGREAARSRLQRLRHQFAYTVFVCPPIVKSDDAILFASTVDGVLLVIEAEATRRTPAVAAKDALIAAKVPLLGAILNNRTYPIPEWLYKRL